MADMKEIRRQQLRRLVNEHEGMNNLAKKLGLAKGAYISQLLTNPPTRDVSEKTARKWERMLRLPEGWLDGAGASVTSANGAAINSELLAQVLVAVTEELKIAKVVASPVQVSELVAMQYVDDLPKGRVDSARVRRLVGLLKR